MRRRARQGVRLSTAKKRNWCVKSSKARPCRQLRRVVKSDLLAPEKAEWFLANRFAMVNVWRSFGASAERFPLAAADGRTVLPADYIAVDLDYPDRTGEIYQNAHSDGQRWFYFSRMQRNEAMLLKCFDTARDGRTRYTAHSGFANPHAPADTPPRESIEVRTLLSFAPSSFDGWPNSVFTPPIPRDFGIELCGFTFADAVCNRNITVLEHRGRS